MKVYIAILTLTYEEYRKNASVCDITNMIYDDIHDTWKVIYGITNKRKLFEKFCNMRKKIKRYTKDVDKYEYKEMLRDNKHAIIEKRPIRYTSTKEINIPMTFHEWLNVTEYIHELYYDDIAFIASIDPRIFINKIRLALSLIGYSNNYYLSFGTEEEREVLEYNNGFGIDLNADINQFNMFLYVYKDMLALDEVYDIVVKEVNSGRVKEAKEE